ncbi:hypothetical protein [Alteromonas portus]|uniref:hypothetical protein n=1 Tax=Alteromonas portus TaxID=2565549 RepID=UPI003BF8F4E2
MKNIERETNSAAVLEIFHPFEDVICQHIDEGLGKGTAERIKQSLGINEIKKFALSQPVDYINILKEHALSEKNDGLLFKIFPGHISEREKLKEVISISDCIVLLKRNTLQSYISNKKAMQVGTYANVDTSSVKVDFNSNEFINWRRSIYSFFNTVFEIANELKESVTSFNYEELYAPSDSSKESLYELLDLKSRVAQINQVVLKKQDKNTTAVGKVNNDREMVSFLIENGWEEMDSITCVDLADK